MADVNRSRVIVTLRNVNQRVLTDFVDVKFYNQRARTLNQHFPLNLEGNPKLLENVPAFPFGVAQVCMTPTTYRYKSIFVNVPSGKDEQIEETFFVDPDRVRPEFPDISTGDRWDELRRILSAPVPVWPTLADQQKAGLLNLYAKMRRETVDGTQEVVHFVDSVREVRPARLFAAVKKELPELVKASDRFDRVDGALHQFPEGWKLFTSYKTRDPAGNLQVTFARNAGGEFLADVDVDDHKGIEHAADVLKHKITGKDTHPYDIHEILIFFQDLDPGYQLLPAAMAREAVA